MEAAAAAWCPLGAREEGARVGRWSLPPLVVCASLLVACTFLPPPPGPPTPPEAAMACCWWMHGLSEAVESGQPHSSCLLSEAVRAARCFSISCVTIASTVSAVWMRIAEMYENDQVANDLTCCPNKHGQRLRECSFDSHNL